MSNQWKDPYTWQEAYADVTEDPETPAEASEFPGGRRNAAVGIDYELTFDESPSGTPGATILVQLYNEKRDTYQDWYETSLSEGNRSLKVDTFGRPGRIVLKNISECTINWLDWTMLNRETGGN